MVRKEKNKLGFEKGNKRGVQNVECRAQSEDCMQRGFV